MDVDEPFKMKEKRKMMVESLMRRGVITSKIVEEAMMSVPRHLFVPAPYAKSAYDDTPLPIGEEQTISAPHMVSIMVEASRLSAGMKILEIGAGSGYQASVMAYITGEEGHVYSVERIDTLAVRAERNIGSAALSDRITVVRGDGSLGLVEHAPYDRIFVTCGAPSLPPPLFQQLAEDGMILIPEGGKRFQTLYEYRKKAGKPVRRKRDGVMFVPLIGEHGFEC